MILITDTFESSCLEMMQIGTLGGEGDTKNLLSEKVGKKMKMNKSFHE